MTGKMRIFGIQSFIHGIGKQVPTHVACGWLNWYKVKYGNREIPIKIENFSRVYGGIYGRDITGLNHEYLICGTLTATDQGK